MARQRTAIPVHLEKAVEVFERDTSQLRPPIPHSREFAALRRVLGGWHGAEQGSGRGEREDLDDTQEAPSFETQTPIPTPPGHGAEQRIGESGGEWDLPSPRRRAMVSMPGAKRRMGTLNKFQFENFVAMKVTAQMLHYCSSRSCCVVSFSARKV